MFPFDLLATPELYPSASPFLEIQDEGTKVFVNQKGKFVHQNDLSVHTLFKFY